MSRSHQRAYELLSERIQLSAWSRWTLYGIVALSFLSGVAWLVVHYFPALTSAQADELRQVGQQALALKVHGLAAFVVLFALGAMGASHVRKAWTLQRNRMSGSVLVACFAVLVATGYALYYLVNDNSRGGVSALHWALGLALAPIIVTHITLGHRGRGRLLLPKAAKRQEPQPHE